MGQQLRPKGERMSSRLLSVCIALLFVVVLCAGAELAAWNYRILRFVCLVVCALAGRAAAHELGFRSIGATAGGAALAAGISKGLFSVLAMLFVPVPPGHVFWGGGGIDVITVVASLVAVGSALQGAVVALVWEFVQRVLCPALPGEEQRDNPESE